MSIPFTKMQGAGNDFVVIDGREINRDWSAMAVQVCNRHLGIGCDSLIILLKSDKADFGMRTWDTDGSEAETCGNGIRCVARYVLEKGLINPDIEELTIETVAAVNRITFEKDKGRIKMFWVNMSQPRLKDSEIPVDLSKQNGNVSSINDLLTCSLEVDSYPITLNFVSMGNPHAVYFTKEPVSSFPMERLGRLIENLPIFPERVNFEVARIIDDTHIEARVWERGVGETQACGSGACAITVASKLNAYTNDRVFIQLPGGTLEGIWNGQGDIVLGGPAESVFEGVWPEKVIEDENSKTS